MNMHKPLLGLVLLAFVAGCTADWDPQRVSSADARRAVTERAEFAAPTSRPATTFAALPDRGELLAYDRSRATRHRGAFTFHPINLSEAHAFRASHEGGELAITAPDGEPLRFRYERNVEHPDGNWTWIGRSAEGADAVLTFGEKAVFGTISKGGQEPLRVTTMAGGAWLVTAERSKMPTSSATTRSGKPDYLVPPSIVAPMAAPGTDMGMASALAAQDVSAAAASNTVDLVIGYTDGFAAQYGGASQAVTRLSNLVDIANLAMGASGVSRRLRAVHAVQVSYPDATESAQALQELTGVGETGEAITVPAALKPLRDAREEHGGDLVSLVRAFRAPESDGCGIAWLIGAGQTPFNADDEAFGYSVVSDGTDEDEGGISYVCRDESLAHELGHNMGQAHNEEDSLQSGVHAYSYGYRETSPSGFYTVMAYRLANSDQFAIRNFANPEVNVGGRPTGVANASDNARSMNQTMPIIAAFRSSVITGFVRNDVDGEGLSDLLLLLESAGEKRLGYWIMDGATIRRTSSVAVDASYRIVATGDFNGDDRLDIVWAGGQRDLRLWLGNGTSFGTHAIGTYPLGWEVIGAGDVDDDGKSDLLLRFASTTHNRFGYWIMDGAAVKRTWSIATSGEYRVAATGDFDGDGHLDIVWTSDRRDLKLWLGTGTSFGASRLIDTYPQGWEVFGAGDINGDDKSDLLLRFASSSQNRFGYWLMNGATVSRTWSVPTSLVYRIAARGDLNGDGRLDIVWTGNQRDLKLWLGTGTSFARSQEIGSYPPGWSVIDPGL